MADPLFAERFILSNQIGDGRMSSVHLAYDSVNANNQVVVKILNTAHPDEIKRELFQRETNALKRLHHTSVVKMLHSGWSDSHQAFYLVLDYLPYSLDQYLRGQLRNELGSLQTYLLMRDLADALAYAHSEGVVHRDIKPSNILLDIHGRPLLTDFGISKLLTQLTVGETLAGYWSGGYASPEQRTGALVEPQSDIFSLGCVFYYLLSGEQPPSEGPAATLVDERISAPTPILNLLKGMLAHNPADRPSSGGQLRTILEATRQLETAPRHFLILTQAAIRDVVSAGYSQREDVHHVAQALIEDLGGMELEDVYIHRDFINDNDLIILGDSLRLICSPDQGGDALAIKAVQTPYPPTLEGEKGRSMSYRAMWEPVVRQFRTTETDATMAAASHDLTELMAKLATYETVGAVTEERRQSRRDFIEHWDRALLQSRNRIEGGATNLDYSAIVEEPDYLRFTLNTLPSDNLNWGDDTPLAVRESAQAPRLSVGNLVGIRGRIVEVARQRRPSHKEETPLPSSGVLTVDITEALVANRRQREAVNAFLYEQMTNTSLGHVILDPAKATYTSDVDVTFYQDWLSEDKKEAVRRALASNELFLIQGPPGTGKTSVISEIVLQILKREPNARILLTSQSNVAVDHALTQISKATKAPAPEMVRVGRPDKIGHEGKSWTLTERARVWREEVLSRCNPQLDSLGAEERRLRAAIRESKESSHDDSDQDSALEEWIEEARAIAEQLQEYEEEYSSLGTDVPLAIKQAAAETIAMTRSELRAQLDALNGLLTQPISTDSLSEEEFLAELLRVSALSHHRTLADANPESLELRRIQELRRTLTDWTRVVGLTQDFHDLIGRSARVVATTCLFSGRRTESAQGQQAFDWAIVDEAGRATVPEVLIPIVKSSRVILVGDERQLPPMVDDTITVETQDTSYMSRLDTSLFQSLVEQAQSSNPECLTSLTTQYRMHHAISDMVSTVFYDGRLSTGDRVGSRNSTFTWMPAPVTWLSTSALPHRTETRGGESYANFAELDVIQQLLEKIEHKCRERNRKPTVGVITGYSAQVEQLSTSIDPANTALWKNVVIEIATVDAFQGRECDVVIYSTVRSNKNRTIGFLADRRRINVALSRARELLVVVGDNAMMESATIGLDLNPFAKVLEYMRLHTDDCKIVDSGLVRLL